MLTEVITIRLQHDPPPIPTREMDWRAWVDGREEDGCEFGSTRFEALRKLIFRIEESDEVTHAD